MITFVLASNTEEKKGLFPSLLSSEHRLMKEVVWNLATQMFMNESLKMSDLALSDKSVK